MPANSEKRNEQLEKFKDDLKAEGERLALDGFPKKLLEINALLESGSFCYSRLPQLAQYLDIPMPDQLLNNSTAAAEDGGVAAKKRRLNDATELIEGTRVLGFVTGTVASNTLLVELVDVVKPILREAVDSVNKVKMWITMLIPRIEDGNNFGVSIQEETLSEVRAVEAEAASFLDQISRYFLSRGKMITRAAKYPHVEDYRRAIQDLDEKQFINLKLVLTEVRNHYATLHDIIFKNFEKIKKPRNSNMEHLY